MGDGFKVSDDIILHPRLELEGGYQSNVFYEDDSEGTLGSPLLRIGVGASLNTESKTVDDQGMVAPKLTLAADLGLTWNQYLASEDTASEQSDLGISALVGGFVLSDDSGLEVDALGGAPGVWSSSFGGEEGNHARNNARLLSEMAGKTERRARFRCTMVLAENGREMAHFSGIVEGRIIDAPRGAQGFGYDPLFIPDGHEATFAELGDAVKNSLSHRSRALAQVIDFLGCRA